VLDGADVDGVLRGPRPAVDVGMAAAVRVLEDAPALR